MLNFVLWAPFAFGLAGLLLPKRLVGWWATLGAGVTLVLAIVVAAGFDPGGGLQRTIDVDWISGLGVSYSLAVDGINVWLVLLTAVIWLPCLAFAALREQERPNLFYLMMLLGQSAVIGAFLAQDLLLFVLFFDLMLVPFYFLFGAWGQDRPDGVRASAATMKMLVYTLVGSLLMLVAAIATAILTAGDGRELTFSMAELAATPLGEGSQDWIFWFFAVAFLVKMPAFLLHGWMSDAYRAAPLPALAVFSAVLSKVGIYGFIKVVLPIFPDATIQFQEVVLVIALASILYGSVMAFTQTNVRLVAGYSSVAQLGFITAGVFALRPDAIDGAILQSVNHAMVVAPLILILAVLAERSGTEDLREMGGMAVRAPVLAALFLIVTLATLAMPGSANFIGEFFILNGLFQAKIVYAIVATAGIAMAAFYALRLYQRTMHNRRPASLTSREIGLGDGLAIGALVACIIALALSPQIVLSKVDSDRPAVEAALQANSEKVGS